MIFRRIATPLIALLLMTGSLAAQRRGSRPAAPTPEDIEQAYLRYDFDRLRGYAESHPDLFEEDAALLQEQFLLGKNMLERVENVAILDSVLVPMADIIDNYRLSPTVGTFTRSEELLRYIPVDIDTVYGYVYLYPESNRAIWSSPVEKDGEVVSSRIYMSIKLADGRWSAPDILATEEDLFGESEGGRRFTSPFMSADGSTMYFSSNGPTSVGGYDIFMTRYDGESRFLQATNAGMPFNSTDNDILMAIDEATGIGWWATNRRHEEDELYIVYLFAPSETRVNVDAEDENLVAYARLDRLPPTNVDRGTLLSRLSNPSIMSVSRPAPDEFCFSLPDGRVMHRLEDFRDPATRRLMEEYLEAAKELQTHERTLEVMRANGARDSQRVESLERATEREREALQQLANKVVNAYMGN